MLTRVAELSHSAQDLVAAASVIGVRSSLPVAAAAAGIGDPVAAFDEACAACGDPGGARRHRGDQRFPIR